MKKIVHFREKWINKNFSQKERTDYLQTTPPFYQFPSSTCYHSKSNSKPLIRWLSRHLVRHFNTKLARFVLFNLDNLHANCQKNLKERSSKRIFSFSIFFFFGKKVKKNKTYLTFLFLSKYLFFIVKHYQCTLTLLFVGEIKSFVLKPLKIGRS